VTYVDVKWEHTDEHVRIVGLSFIVHADGLRERPKGEREHEQPAGGDHEHEGGKAREAAANLDGPGPAENAAVYAAPSPLSIPKVASLSKPTNARKFWCQNGAAVCPTMAVASTRR